jgi:hypothetical protein
MRQTQSFSVQDWDDLVRDALIEIDYIAKCRSGEQAKAPEARVALAADHQVIGDRNPERLGRGPDLARHVNLVE